MPGGGGVSLPGIRSAVGWMETGATVYSRRLVLYRPGFLACNRRGGGSCLVQAWIDQDSGKGLSALEKVAGCRL